MTTEQEFDIDTFKEQTERETNEIVKQIEKAIRTKKEGWNHKRFGSLQAEFIRQTIWKYKIGKLVCKKCLFRSKKAYPWIHAHGRYCCKEHKLYYQRLTNSFYFKPKPWKKGEGDSIDHILPIANGGLEFDKDNLQWMDLRENIKKSGGKRYEDRLKQKKLNQKEEM